MLFGNRGVGRKGWGLSLSKDGMESKFKSPQNVKSRSKARKGSRKTARIKKSITAVLNLKQLSHSYRTSAKEPNQGPFKTLPLE